MPSASEFGDRGETTEVAAATMAADDDLDAEKGEQLSLLSLFGITSS